MRVSGLLFAMIGLLGLLGLGGCTKVFYHPDRNLYYDPARLGYAYDDVFFPSSDGTKLHGWFFRATGPKGEPRNGAPKGTIIQLHGNAENLSSHYISLVWLTREGYDLFTFDYRGYGKSEGEISPQGLESDALAGIRHGLQLAHERKSKRAIAYGQSLGGLALLAGLTSDESMVDVAEKQPSRLAIPAGIDLLVLDSTFSSYKQVAGQKLRSFWFTWLFSPLSFLLVSDGHGPMAHDERLARLTMPKIVIGDRDDPVVPYRNSEILMERLPDPKELWTVNRGRHVGFFAIDTPENRQRFLEAMERIR